MTSGARSASRRQVPGGTGQGRGDRPGTHGHIWICRPAPGGGTGACEVRAPFPSVWMGELRLGEGHTLALSKLVGETLCAPGSPPSWRARRESRNDPALLVVKFLKYFQLVGKQLLPKPSGAFCFCPALPREPPDSSGSSNSRARYLMSQGTARSLPPAENSVNSN